MRPRQHNKKLSDTKVYRKVDQNNEVIQYRHA